ncbi:hypothetical protein [Undibacterium sp. TJN19]|uniref:hypothetical protein n=1 Tax=Undibacterium sp. TJN19 TaxID=3413055 RepID=UPI003BF4001E
MKLFNGQNSVTFALVAGLISMSSNAEVPWPDFKGKTKYTVPRSEISISVDVLEIPNDKTIEFESGITVVQWSARIFRIGSGATLDLRSSEGPPAAPEITPGLPKSVPSCSGGNGGIQGFEGLLGRNGIDFTLSGVESIDKDKGSLWVRTDGGKGGKGGKGGTGGTGGAPNTACKARDGGPGGDPGIGGAGGRTATVKFFRGISGDPYKFPDESAPASQCGPSDRPPSANGATAFIGIYGNPGCQGDKGEKGDQGKAGGSK